MKRCCFIFGLGYTAQFLTPKLQALSFDIIGTTRDAQKISSQSSAVTLIDFNDVSLETYLRKATHLLISIPPSIEGDPVLLHYAELIHRNASHIQWLGYLSSTGVYGDHQGAWVDEHSANIKLGQQASIRLEAETSWQTFASNNNLPLHIFRLAGIYGPGRNALQRIRAGKMSSIYKAGQFFSRIHVEDIAAILLASMAQPKPFSIYNVADDEPSPAHEVDAYAASLLHHQPLELIDYDKASLSPMEQQFYANNRRVANHKIKNELGVKLQYPTYREGLKQLCQNDVRWK